MMSGYSKMTEKKIQSLCREGENGKFCAGDRLYLEIKGGSHLWAFRWMRDGRSRQMTLGPYPALSLAKAREKAREAHKLVIEGIDPIALRRSQKAANSHTFAECVDRLILKKKSEWKNPKQAKQWRATLERYAFVTIENLPVSQITREHILTILDPIWEKRHETASRVRGRIKEIIDYAIVLGWRSDANPAVWQGALEKLLPARNKIAKTKHRPAVPWRKIGAVMDALGRPSGLAAKCLQFVILTAARSGEARGARWSEIDFEARLWTIPAERMKAGRQHLVPLSEPALALLRELLPLRKSEDDLIFAGGKPGKPLSDVALSKALRSAFSGTATVHGMRSTFRDWCAEQTDCPREIAEAALAHGNADKVEAAYRRTDYLDKRRALMAEWGAFLTTP